LWETYLPAFKNLVVDAGVKEVMCAYNRFEGQPCCGSKTLLVDILRNKWGFKGIIVSDCWAINDFYEKNRHATHPDGKSAASDAVISGTDLECGSTYKTLIDGVKSGLITEEQINTSVIRLMKARFELGEMDLPSLVPYSIINLNVVNSKKHQQLALEAARKSIVLLLNKKAILPLSKSGFKIAVMGPNANDSIMQRANYEGIPAKTSTILQGIKTKTNIVAYEKGSNHVGSIVIESAFDKMKTPDGNSIGFTAEYWNTVDMTGSVIATQVVSNAFNFSNGGATVFAPGVNLTNFSSKYKGVFSPVKDGEVVLQITGDDAYRVFINDEKVIEYWGKKRSESSEYKLMAKMGEKYEITIEYMQSINEALLKFDLGYEKPFDPVKTVEKVKEADVVIFVGGISPKLEGEEMRVNFPGFKGGDRTDIELPAVQRDLLKALKAAGKKVIFVNCSGSAMGLTPEMETCDAIVQAWYSGEAGGIAVADVLFGDYNPSGKLPITFYKNVNQLPDFEDYSMNNRTYRFMKEQPLFAFGHGLSYSKFEFENANFKSKKIKSGASATLNFSIKNSSAIIGDAVAQVYIRNVQDKGGPIKTLRAFKRVSLNANENKEVTINLPASSFEFFDSDTSSMQVKPGVYEVLLGGSSIENELKKLTIEIK
jgi:beta-glucosidase